MHNLMAYRITCIPTGRVYVGITSQGLRRRWNQHLSASKKGSTKLSRAIRKYGKGAFVMEQIASSWSYEHLLEFESLLISQWDSAGNGLNCTLGGEGVVGHRHTSESRLAMSEARPKVWSQPGYREDIAAAQSAAWKRKSEEELEKHRERARRPKGRRAKPKPNPVGPGKGHNMRIKTHCPSGHEYTPENTVFNTKGSRVCRQCKKSTRNKARDSRRLEQRAMLRRQGCCCSAPATMPA